MSMSTTSLLLPAPLQPPTATASTASTPLERRRRKLLRWKVRPVSPDDEAAVNALLRRSFKSLLTKDYEANILTESLPFLTKVQPEHLTCPTWFVVEENQDEEEEEEREEENDDKNDDKNERPSGNVNIINSKTKEINKEEKEKKTTRKIIGCGGWTRDAIPGPYASTTPVPRLRRFATDPDYTRCGVGSALWKHIWSDITLKYRSSPHQHQPPPSPDQQDLLENESSTSSGTIPRTPASTTTTCTTNAREEQPTDVEEFSSLNAVPFYQSLGFEKVQDVIMDVTPTCPFPVVLMRRRQRRR